ncbi:MAG: WD40 repeat domain-containing protein [Nannocystaceae bacterium]|nr:WD40 repeat domain-containing protein [Nannocystaceae bacterium]
MTRAIAAIVGSSLALGLAGLGLHYRNELREALWAAPPRTLPEPPAETATTTEDPTNQTNGFDVETLASNSLTVTDPNVRLMLQAGIAGEIIGQRAPLSSGPGWDLFAWTQDALATMNETPFVGHTQAITAVAIGPAGRWMVSGSADNSARLYDLSGPAPVVAAIFRGHWGPVSAIAFSPDGTMLITASEDNAVRRWDLTAKDPAATARVLRRHDSEVSHLAWHPAGQFLISADVGGTLVSWDMRAPDPQATATSHVAHTAPITALLFSGERLYTASDDRLARRFTLSPEGKLKRLLRFEAHLGGVASLAVSSDGRFVATGGTDGEVYLWDQDSKSPGRFAAALLGHDQSVNALVFTPDVGQLVTASDDDTLRVWNVRAKDPSVGSVVLPGHTGDITSVHIAADGTKVVSTGLDNAIRVWDIAKSDRVVDQYALVGHQGPITAFAVSTDRLWAVSGSSDATVRVWDLLSRTPGRGGKLLRLGAGPVYDAAMSRLGDRVVAVGVDGGVALWDLQQPAVSPRPTRLRGLKDLVNATAYDPQGRYIATGSDSGEVTLWPITEADPSAQRRTLGGPGQQHEGPVNALAFTPGGERLLSVSSDRTVIAWAIDNEAPPEVWRGHRDEIHTLAMSPSGDFAFSAGLDGAILRWPLADGQRGTAAELRGHEGEVLKLRISNDGKLLASASADRRARLWDVATGSPTLVFRGHDEAVSAVAFGPKQALATAGHDRKILVWDLGSKYPDESPRALLGHEQTINDLTFVGETDLLVSASNDATIRVWQLSTGASTTLVGNDRPVTRVMVGPRGRMLLSTGYDGTVRMWPLDAEVLQWLVCDAVGRPVDVTTWNTFFGGSPPPRVCAPR